nr:retrovirus-related Pol polyprotein from transposon TNT 1-94 [Tanacetum cinerariifolium]
MFLTHSNEALKIEKFKRSRANILSLHFRKIDFPFQQTSSLKPYVPNVILEKIITDLEDEVVSLLEKEKANLKTIESLKSKGFESSENVSSELENQIENDYLVVEKECNKEENPKVIAPGMFKLNVSQCVSPISMSKSSWKIHQKHHKSKMAFPSNKPLYLLHMDLCGPVRVQSINGKRYVLVVVDDYSRYTWVFFLHSKDEASEVIISFIKKTQVNLQLQVQRVRTDNGMIFKNKTLAKFFDEAEAIATACFTQNRSIIHKCFDKTPYELINKRKPNIKFFYVFRCRCYLLNDYEDVGKLKVKGGIGVFVRKTESEYVVVSSCCAQVLWMCTQLTDYGFFYDKVPIFCDSKSAIAISCNPVQHTRTKHIDVRYHFIKDHVEKGIIELYFVGTEYQLADLFTKSLPEARFKFLVEKLGMMSSET